MKKLNSSQIYDIVQGSKIYALGNIAYDKVAQDSRLVQEGDVFFAIKGDNSDGHLYIDMAIENGAKLLIISKEESFDEDYFKKSNVEAILVENSELALHKLAKWYMDYVNPVRIGLTGSVGKTTTRDIVSSIVSAKYKVHKNKQNYNSSIGAALTVLEMPQDTEVAVIEMGMDKFGEIHLIAGYVRPNIAIITNIGSSHMEVLGSRENIFRAKMEILDFADENTTLICIEDDFLNRLSIEKRLDEKKLTLGKLIILGEDALSDFQLNIENHSQKDWSFKLKDKSHIKLGLEDEIFHINMMGRHNCNNSALGIIAGRLLNIDSAEINQALSSLNITGKRLEETVCHGIRIIDDSYNASPESMKAALDVLAQFKGRKIAVLGDMYQLGKSERTYHEEMGKYAEARTDVLITVGQLGIYIGLGGSKLEENNIHFDQRQEALNYLKKNIKKGDTILIKASRGLGLDVIAKELIEYLKN